MKYLDIALSILLILESAGHGIIGNLWASGWDVSSKYVFWSFSGSIAIWMIAGVNLLRVSRSQDKGLAMLALGGALVWLFMMIWYGVIADMLTDPRIIAFVLTCGGLAFFSLRTLRNAS